MNHYTKLLLTLVISLVVMYVVMYLNVDSVEHVYLSLTRFYMSLLMVTPMAILMLIMMPAMYQDKKKNTLMYISGTVVFVVALICLRSQTPVGDIQYMKAMIPHHSSAIMTSRHADLKDPEVKRLAEGIIRSQEREIAEMKEILVRMGK